MKIDAFVSPHVCDFFGTPLHYFCIQRKALKKYEYLLNGDRIVVIINSHTSSFIGRYTKFLPELISIYINRIELYLWAIINQKKVHILDSSKMTSEMVIFAHSYKSLNSATNKLIMRLKKTKTIVHLSHAHVDVIDKARFIKELNPYRLAADADLMHSPLFRKLYSWYSNEINIINPKNKYISKYNVQTADDKKYKVSAVGTYHEYGKEWNSWRYKEYLKIVQLPTMHPDRYLCREIPNQEKVFYNFCYPIRPYGRKRSLLRHFLVSQSQYFSLNIKEILSQSKYVIPGIDYFGCPSIIADEAVALGAKLLTTKELFHLWPRQYLDHLVVIDEFNIESFRKLE